MSPTNPLHDFLSVLADHALLGRLFFASVEMAVLAGIVWLIVRISRRASPRLCSILWLLVMAKALVALAIGAPLAIIRIHPPEPEPFAVTYEPRFDYEETVPSFEPEVVLPLVAVEPGPAEPAPPAGWSFSWKWNAAETISGAWIVGAILVGLYAALNRVRLHRLVSRALAPPAGIAERYSAAVKHLRIKRPPKLRVTHVLESPALVGTLAPTILLPAWMSDKPSNAQLDWSLRHELTHWKLGDPFADFVRQIARILFFFHPVTWWASRKWEESAELACDRVLVRTESEAESYAGELYQILAQIHGRRMRPAMGGLFATRTQIGRRIAALLSSPLKSPARLGLVATLGLIVVAVISCAVGGAFVGKGNEEASVSGGEIREPEPERRERSQSHRKLKATIKEAYWDKYQYLESYALHYSGEWVSLDEETGAVTSRLTEDVEVLTRGDNKAVRESRLVPSTGERAEVVRVVTGGVYRSLFMNRPDTGPFRGHTWTVSSARKGDTLNATPLGYSRLDSMRWPKDGVLHANGANNDMTVLMNLPDSRVLPDALQVDGRECYVVERGPRGSPWTKLYLAKDLGFAVSKLESFHREGSSRFLGFSITFNDFAEAAPGLYMPQEGEMIGYKGNGSLEYRRRWHKMSLDLAPDLPDDAFVLEFPDGTEVTDEDTMRTYISLQGQLVTRQEYRSKPMVGKDAPELDVAEWVGGEATSLAALRGRTVVLAFWDRSDEACAPLVALLNGLVVEYSEESVEIVCVHSYDADVDALGKFISDKSIRFRVAVDKPVKLYKGATFEKYNVWEVPAIFLIDSEGKVTYQDISLVAVEQAVKTLMEEADTEAATEGSSDSGTRTIRFPEDRSMGRLMIRDAGGQASPYDGWVDFCEARGEVRVAEGKQLQLVPGRDAGKDFTPLGRLRPDDLAWINCWHVPVDDDGLRHIAGLTGLGALTLRYAPVTDDGLEHLKGLTSLVALNLFGTKVRGEGLTHLSGMRSLQILTLSSTAITDQGLAHLPEFPSLIHLGLARLDITDAGLAHIEKMHSLKELRLYDTRITDEGLISVAQLTSLEDLRLRGTRITEAGLAVLKPLESLRRFDFREVGDEGLAHLKKLKSLEAVGLSDRVTDKGLQYLREFPSLKEISGISSNKILQVIAELPKMQSLESLGIRGDGVTDVGMECVARLEGLKSVRLSGCNVTNKGLAKLAVLRSLQSLELWNTAVTSSGLEHLAELPSLSQLWFVGFIIDKTGLAHLGDVRRLELLHLGGADVRDDDLKHLVSLHHMRSLRLQSGEITDKGIAHLSGLALLEGLDIPWGSLTDEGLGQLAKLKKLNYLLVRGKFSDRGLEYLEKLPSLGSLTLIGGEFSADALARFRRRMPSLRYLNVGQAR